MELSLSRKYSMNVSMLGLRTTTSSWRQQLAERVELVVRLEALCGQASRGAFEDAAQLERIVDVRARELTDDEATARKRLEEALVGEGHQRDPERRPRHAELLDEPQLGNALARLEHSAQQEFTEPEDRLRRL